MLGATPAAAGLHVASSYFLFRLFLFNKVNHPTYLRLELELEIKSSSKLNRVLIAFGSLPDPGRL